MTEPRMPTTLPSPVDRAEFRFVAVGPEGTLWRWVDNEMIWVRGAAEQGVGDPPPEGGDVVH